MTISTNSTPIAIINLSGIQAEIGIDQGDGDLYLAIDGSGEAVHFDLEEANLLIAALKAARNKSQGAV